MHIFKSLVPAITAALVFISCNFSQGRRNHPDAYSRDYIQTQEQLNSILEKGGLEKKVRCGIIKKIASNMIEANDYPSLIIFLTEQVEQNSGDPYNAYWLLMTAYAYLEKDAKPVAEYYFERIINDCEDLLIGGKSIHFLSLQHLIQISTSPANRISYFEQLINRFPNDVRKTELYYRLALEYEKEGEWNQAMKNYQQFLDQSDSKTIQIPGIPNAYINARQLIDFKNSPQDWTFDTLEELVSAVKSAISSYNYSALDSYKSKVNFFAMSWRQDEMADNAQQSFSMHNYMLGNRIRYSTELDSSSTPTEAFLRTTGWSTYINVWYLYFRKVNFPSNPDIHGNWEWAGIYFGEKL